MKQIITKYLVEVISSFMIGHASGVLAILYAIFCFGFRPHLRSLAHSDAIDQGTTVRATPVVETVTAYKKTIPLN